MSINFFTKLNPVQSSRLIRVAKRYKANKSNHLK